EDDLRGNGEESPGIDRGNRTVPAHVETPAARLNVSDQLVPAVALETRITLEARELRATRKREIEALEMRPGHSSRDGHRRPCGAPMCLDRPRQLREWLLSLSADHAIRRVCEQVLSVQRRVEAVEADVTAGIHRTHPLGDTDADAKRRVHGHRDRDERCAPNTLHVEGLDRHVHHGRPVAQILEYGCGPRHGESLMPDLIACDEENLSWRSQGFASSAGAVSVRGLWHR